MLDLKNKTIFITGGAGFIGSNLTKHFLQMGCKVYVYDNLMFGKQEYVYVPEDTFINESILNRKALFEAIQRIQPHVIIHLAAIHFIPYNNQNPFESSLVNIKGTSNVVDAALSVTSVEKFFFASTASIYPIMGGAISEDIEPEPSDIYGLSKYAAEKIVASYHHKTKVPTVIGRIFNVYGKNDTIPHLIPDILEQIKHNNSVIQLGNTYTKRDYIYIDDVISCIYKLLMHQQQGLDFYNIGTGNDYSVVEIIEYIQQIAGKKLQITIDNLKVRKADRPVLKASIKKLYNTISWQPATKLEEGLNIIFNANK